MGKIGRISTLAKDYSNLHMQTMQGSLSAQGFTRVPGTGVFMYPYKELDGTYRTGLDPKAGYINRIQDKLERDLEIERVTELRKKLEKSLGGLDLEPRSKFWNYSLASSPHDPLHVKPVKLMNGDNFFDFISPFSELTFAWIRVHPMIASSFQAYENGEYPADTQFYVADNDIENAIIFNKKQLINKAVAKFDGMTPEKKRKIARLLGLPVSEDSKDEIVYNLVDNLLKESEFKNGKYQGLSTIEVFNRFADMQENLLHIKDLVKQAIAHSVYRIKGSGRIYEGDLEIATDEDDLVKFLIDDEHQSELLTLEGKLKIKKMAQV